MTPAKLLAWNVRRLRVKQKLSQEGLAVDADVNVSYLSGLENGSENPTLAVIERLATALGVQFVELFKAPGKSEAPPEPLPKGRRKSSR
jgi:transcriptional regulator with XRE-family HTH domain